MPNATATARRTARVRVITRHALFERRRERREDLRIVRTAHLRIEVGEEPVGVLSPRPNMQVPDLEIVLMFETMAEQHGRHRVARPETIGHDKLDAVESILTTR